MIFTSYIDSIHYKIGYKLDIYLKNINHNNIIVYGPENIGKSTLISLLFKDIYGDTIYNQNDCKFNHKYYYFDVLMISNKNDFIDFIKKIINTYDHINFIKYIILDHFDNLSLKYQNSLKIIIEKSYLSSRFILITNNISKVISPIKSRCFFIRIPSPNKYDKYFHFNSELKLEDCKNIELINNTYIQLNDTILSDIIREIIIIVKNKLSIQKIKKIRELCEKIKELNISYKDFYNQFMKEEKNINIDLLKIFTEYELLYNKSYHSLIHFEALILKIHGIYYIKKK